MHATARKDESESLGDLDGLSLSELASLIGEKPHKLSRFVAAGVIQANGDGRFAIEPSLASYWRYWRDVIAKANQLRRWRVSGETLAGHALRRSLEAR